MIKTTIKAALLFLIRLYQAMLSPLFYGSCRFHPSCSHYAAEALEVHGPIKGSWLALGRLLRCQPFCKGGFDPVPPVPEARHKTETLSFDLSRGSQCDPHLGVKQ